MLGATILILLQIADSHKAIDSVKQLEQTLGFEQTANFLHHSDRAVADYRCYYTGKLELPISYDGLELKDGGKDGCPEIDTRKYDVFFYPIEAVANGRAPVTESLASSSIERLLVVVPHEDFHEHQQVKKLPERISEAASTLIGFLTAAEAARLQFGPGSPAYQNLSKEAELFLRKAEMVNRHHESLSALYESVRKRRVLQMQALSLKREYFAGIEQQCSAMPRPSSFNRCLSANNNAGLAFDMTYTKYYPLLYEVFRAHAMDLKATVAAIQNAPSTDSERRAEEYFLSVIHGTSHVVQ